MLRGYVGRDTQQNYETTRMELTGYASRDYFDLKRIEELTGRRVEEGIGLYMTRYHVPPEHPSIEHIVESLGYLDDIDDDDMLPERHAAIAAYWKRRQPEISRSLARFPGA